MWRNLSLRFSWIPHRNGARSPASYELSGRPCSVYEFRHAGTRFCVLPPDQTSPLPGVVIRASPFQASQPAAPLFFPFRATEVVHNFRGEGYKGIGPQSATEVAVNDSSLLLLAIARPDVHRAYSSLGRVWRHTTRLVIPNPCSYLGFADDTTRSVPPSVPLPHAGRPAASWACLSQTLFVVIPAC